MWWEQFTGTDYAVLGLSLWVALLSFFLFKTVGHYKKLSRIAPNISLDRLLEKVIRRQDDEAKKISELSQSLVKTQTHALAHFQKQALIRFNPFEDAGGDQSFVIALLDGKNNGVVISSLHSRNGTRVYAKGIVNAKPLSHQFTKEEREAVEKAAQSAKIKRSK